MSIGSKRTGFTLIEVLASVTLLSVGMVAVLQGFSVMTRARARMAETEVMTRLAHDKLDEVIATSTNITGNDSGDFTDRNNQKYKWSVNATTSTVSNLYSLNLTLTSDTNQDKTVTVNSLVYVAPTSTGGTQ